MVMPAQRPALIAHLDTAAAPGSADPWWRTLAAVDAEVTTRAAVAVARAALPHYERDACARRAPCDHGADGPHRLLPHEALVRTSLEVTERWLATRVPAERDAAVRWADEIRCAHPSGATQSVWKTCPGFASAGIGRAAPVEYRHASLPDAASSAAACIAEVAGLPIAQAERAVRLAARDALLPWLHAR